MEFEAFQGQISPLELLCVLIQLRQQPPGGRWTQGTNGAGNTTMSCTFPPGNQHVSICFKFSILFEIFEKAITLH